MPWWRWRTSVAKDIKGLQRDKSALDDEQALKEEFRKAHDAVEKSNKPAPELGSRMVRESAPGLGPTPSGYMRRVPDKFAVMRRLEEERKEAAARNRAVEREWQKLQDRKGRTVDNEREEEAPVYGNPSEHPEEPAEKAAEQESPEAAWARFQERQAEIDRGRERER